MNENKCKFFQKEIKILGHVVSGKIVKPDPKKIEAIKNYKRPETIKELRSFLGLCNYVRPFVINYAQVTSALNEILRGESKRSIKKINWTKSQNDTFNFLIQSILKITHKAQLQINRPFILTTDASNDAYGSILSQIDDFGREHMISTFSKKMDKHQINYSVTDKELLAVVKSIEHYRHYLLGQTFHLRTDHKSIEYLNTKKNPTGRFLRWALKLQEYNFRIEYVKGDLNGADGLSRYININSVRSHYKKNDDDLTQEEKQMILKEYHLTSGHGSAANMKHSLKDKYKWQGIFKDIEDYVKGCLTCLKEGYEKNNTKNKIIKTTRPNEMWECDLIGRLKASD